MLTPRDRKVVIHLGFHGWLTHNQLQRLEFPSYQTLQRRIREELMKNDYIERKYYVDEDGKQTPVFRLSKKGTRLFKKDTGNKAIRPRFSQLKMEHRLTVNEVLVWLKTNYKQGMDRYYIGINDFELEKKFGSVRADAYVEYDIPFALEVDMSNERKDFICKKWRQYEREYMQGNMEDCRYVVWYSNRSQQLYDWIEINSQLEPIFISAKSDNMQKVIDYVNPDSKIKAIK